MLLEDENAVIYGAGGSIGGAVAKEFVREGARSSSNWCKLRSLGWLGRDPR